MKKRFGFTLAEVLITLGIIGVVAAMTIPTLIQNTNSVKFASQFKKSVSTLSQAALMSQAQYDIDYSLLDKVSTDSDCATDVVSDTAKQSMCGLFNSTLAGKVYQGAYGTVKLGNATTPYSIKGPGGGDATPTVAFTNYLIYALSDGSWVGFNPNATKCSVAPGTVLDETKLKGSADGNLVNCLGFIDVNGATGPNEEVSCATASATKASLKGSDECALGSTAGSVSDVYPILFHDGTVEPATNAAKAVLARGKSNTQTQQSSGT